MVAKKLNLKLSYSTYELQVMFWPNGGQIDSLFSFIVMSFFYSYMIL